MSDPYLTLKQVSAELSISERTARNWAAANKIPGAARFGRSWRVRRLDYEAWKQAHHDRPKPTQWVWPKQALVTPKAFRELLREQRNHWT